MIGYTLDFRTILVVYCTEHLQNGTPQNGTERNGTEQNGTEQNGTGNKTVHHKTVQVTKQLELNKKQNSYELRWLKAGYNSSKTYVGSS